MTVKNTGRHIVRGIAGILAAALCLEAPAFAGVAGPLAPYAAAPAAGAFGPGDGWTGPIIDPAAAHVEDRFETSGPDRVILIQDAHTNPSAQFNTAGIIRSLMERRGLKTVFLEGGSGDDSLSGLKQAAKVADVERAAKRLVRDGVIQGAEYVSLMSDGTLSLWGVEDTDLYRQALEAYRTVAAGRIAALSYLDELDVTAEYLRSRTYPSPLKRLDEARRSYAQEKVTVSEYLSLLQKTARLAQMDVSDDPGLKTLDRLSRRESALRTERVSEELRQSMLRLPEENRRVFEARFAAGTAPVHPSEAASNARSFEAALRASVPGAVRRWPQLFGWLRTAQMSSALDGLAVLRSARVLEARLYRALATPRVYELVRATRALEAFRGLMSLALQPEDLVNVRANATDAWDLAALSGFLNRRIIDGHGDAAHAIFDRPDLEPVFDAARDFYRLTGSRDRAFVKNLLARMRATGETEAVLVAGGYHAANLKKLLRDRGISYVSIVPHVTGPTDLDRYEKFLLAQPLDPGSSRGGDVSGGVVTVGAMNLRPVVEDDMRGARLAEGLGIPNGALASLRGARLASDVAVVRPVFDHSKASVTLSLSGGAEFSTTVRFPEDVAPSGDFYLRYGVPEQRWDFLRVIPRPGDEPGQWKLTASIEPFIEGSHRYEGTFVWFEPGVKPRKINGEDPSAEWQAKVPGANAGKELLLDGPEAAQQKDQAYRDVRGAFEQTTEVPFERLLAHRTIPAIRGALGAAVDLLRDEGHLDIRARLRLYQFVRDLFDLRENYLGLPAAWFTHPAGIEKIQSLPDAQNLDSAEAVAEHFWRRTVSLLREDLQQRLHSHIRSKIRVPHIRWEAEETAATADARIDLMHGGIARDLPVFSGSGQAVVNAAIRLRDYKGKAVPGFGIRVRMPEARNPSSPTIRFAGHYYNVLKQDTSTPAGYQVIKKFEHVYEASFSPDAAEDLQAKYAIGALSLLMDLIGQDNLEGFLRQNGRDISIEIDSFLPERTGMGGSVTLGALLMTALMEHLTIRDEFTHEDIALLGMYLEATLGDLGGWQDGYLGRALRYLEISEGQPVTTLRNRIQLSDRNMGNAQQSLLDQLEKHGVLFLSHPHRSSHTLKQLIGGYLRRDRKFIAVSEEGQADLMDFWTAFSTASKHGTNVSMEDIGRWMDRATEQFEEAAPGFITRDMAEMIRYLKAQGWIRAAKPVGAGAGGFIFFLLASPDHRDKVENYLKEWARNNEARIRAQVDENFVAPGVYGAALNPQNVPGRTIAHSDVVGAAARMAASPQGNWHDDRAEQVALNAEKASRALKQRFTDALAFAPESLVDHGFQRGLNAEFDRYLVNSAEAWDRLAKDGRLAWADLVLNMREEVVEAWRNYESFKYVHIRAHRPVQANWDWDEPGRLYEAADKVHSQLDRLRSTLKGSGVLIRAGSALKDFENVHLINLRSGLANSMIIPRAGDPEDSDAFEKGLDVLEAVGDMLADVNPDDFLPLTGQSPQGAGVQITRIERDVTELLSALSSYLDLAHERFENLSELPPLPPGPTRSFSGPGPDMEAALEGALTGIKQIQEWERLSSVAGLDLVRVGAKGNDATDQQLLTALRSLQAVAEYAQRLMPAAYHGVYQMGLTDPEKVAVRLWADRQLQAADPGTPAFAKAEALLGFVDRIQEAIALTEDGDRDLPDTATKIGQNLLLNVLRPFLMDVLARSVAGSDPFLPADTYESLSQELHTALKLATNRQNDIGVAFSSDLAAGKIDEAIAYLRSWYAASGSRLAARQDLRLTRWLQRPAASSFLQGLSGSPLSADRSFALRVREFEPVILRLERGEGAGGDRFAVVRDRGLDAPKDVRPSLTLATRPAAARMSVQNSIFGPAEVRVSGSGTAAVSAAPVLITGAVRQARHDVDETLRPVKDPQRYHGAVLDLAMFQGLSSKAYSAMVPMMVAAARRAQTRVGGNAVIRVAGPPAARKRFFREAGDKADGLFVDAAGPVPSEYAEVEFTSIGFPSALDTAKPKRPLPVGPFVRSDDLSGEVSLPAFEVWFDAAFFLSTPEPSEERLLEFFRRRSTARDLTIEDVRKLLNGKPDLSLLVRIALPPLVRVPLADLVRAAATAARMSERSA